MESWWGPLVTKHLIEQSDKLWSYALFCDVPRPPLPVGGINVQIYLITREKLKLGSSAQVIISVFMASLIKSKVAEIVALPNMITRCRHGPIGCPVFPRLLWQHPFLDF